MSKTMLVGDLHLHNWPAFADSSSLAGLNTRALLVLDCLQAVMAKAVQEHCGSVIFLGDIFETHKPSVQLQNALVSILGFSSPDVWLMVGNHDRGSMSENDHALAVIQHVSGFGVAEKPIYRPGMVLIPWTTRSTMQEIENTMKARAERGNLDASILCLHAGLYDKSEGFLPEQGDKTAHDAIEVNELTDVCRKYNIRRVFSGHWHAYKEYTHGPELTITQLGALVPSGFNNAEHPSRYGNCVIVNDDLTFDRVSIRGPRFLRDTSLEGMRKQLISASLGGYDHLYASIKPPVQDVPQVRDMLTTWLGEGQIRGFTVEPSLDSIRTQADKIRASISRDSAEEAIVDFIADSAPSASVASLAAKMAVSAWKKA